MCSLRLCTLSASAFIYPSTHPYILAGNLFTSGDGDVCDSDDACSDNDVHKLSVRLCAVSEGDDLALILDSPYLHNCSISCFYCSL